MSASLCSKEAREEAAIQEACSVGLWAPEQTFGHSPHGEPHATTWVSCIPLHYHPALRGLLASHNSSLVPKICSPRGRNALSTVRPWNSTSPRDRSIWRVLSKYCVFLNRSPNHGSLQKTELTLAEGEERAGEPARAGRDRLTTQRFYAIMGFSIYQAQSKADLHSTDVDSGMRKEGTGSCWEGGRLWFGLGKGPLGKRHLFRLPIPLFHPSKAQG